MDLERLEKHVESYKRALKADPEGRKRELDERRARKEYFSAWTPTRLGSMSEEALLEMLAKLWAMRIWSNKAYVVEKLVKENGLDHLRQSLSDLLWGQDSIAARWDRFRSNIKGMGPAMMSELLCHVHPNECILWNRRAYVALDYLGASDLPRYDYQLTGARYEALSAHAKLIAKELAKAGFSDSDLLTVDYFLWSELQVAENLSKIHKRPGQVPPDTTPPDDPKSAEFLHNDVRDKLKEIGEWLGFKANIEVVVAAGSKVDTVWEATIGNLGRVIYVFEVQTKGSIDSLIVNLLKSLNNPAVQGVVAVSDSSQIPKIRAHSGAVAGLGGKLKVWNYEEVLQVYEDLASVNEIINKLQLVPDPF